MNYSCKCLNIKFTVSSSLSDSYYDFQSMAGREIQLKSSGISILYNHLVILKPISKDSLWIQLECCICKISPIALSIRPGFNMELANVLQGASSAIVGNDVLV